MKNLNNQLYLFQFEFLFEKMKKKLMIIYLFYSYRNASTGSSREARHAGYSPNTMATITPKRKASPIVLRFKTGVREIFPNGIPPFPIVSPISPAMPPIKPVRSIIKKLDPK